MLDINKLRNEYQLRELRRKDLSLSPFIQFKQWFEEAIRAEIYEPNAMSLATCTKEGVPSCRTVLMKNFSEQGIIFYTYKKSHKGRDLSSNPIAALVFLWKELERQVLIRGSVEIVSDSDAESYFHSRPRGSQLGAFASKQDTPVASRTVLENELHRLETLYADAPIPMPENWGGYRVIPTFFEFWQGRPNRLHDRFAYCLEEGKWAITRLSP